MDSPTTSLGQKESSMDNIRNNPKRLLMWLYIGSMVMLFAALTSALLVSMADNKAHGRWVDFSLPDSFIISTILVVLSSGTLHWAYLGAKSEKFSQLTNGLWITVLLGIAFLTSQFIAFSELVAKKIFIVGSVSGSFVYVITGFHGLHLFAAIIALIVMLIKAIQFKIRKQKMLGLELATIFWHSLGILWIYLYIFLSNYYG